MFTPNLGKTERAIRLLLGLLVSGWIFRRHLPGIPETVAAVIALCLFLNALLARCYLWRALGISSCPIDTKNTAAPPQGRV
jgi:hypothetical protein